MMLRILLLVALALGVVLAAGAHEAIVTGVTGKVTFQGKPVKPGLRLENGARLEVAAGGSVTVVYLTDAHKETLAKAGTLTVGGFSADVAQTSGPGTIQRKLSGNSRAAASRVRDSELDLEFVRTGPQGEAELVYYVKECDPKLTVALHPADQEQLKPDSETLASGGHDFGHFETLPDARMCWYPGKHQHKVVKLPYKLEQGSLYWLEWTGELQNDEFPDIPSYKVQCWLVAMSPERADSLREMKKWAYQAPTTPEKYLSLVQIAYEWQDYYTALEAARQARDLRKDTETTEFYRRLLLLHGLEDNTLGPASN